MYSNIFRRGFCEQLNDIRVLKPGSKRLNYLIFGNFQVPISFQLSEALLKETPVSIKPIKFQGRFLFSDSCTR